MNIRERIMQAALDGLINGYMRDRLSNTAHEGLTESLCEDLLSDAQYASDVGVNDDRGYNIYFNTYNLANDLADDTFGIKLDDAKKKDLCHYTMGYAGDDNYKFDNLTDYRIIMHKWLCDQLSKTAYPNIEGKTNKEPGRDVDKWVETLKNIYSLIRSKKTSRQQALDQLTTGWDAEEKYQFSNWMRYYEDGTTEKYNVKTAKLKQALDFDFALPSSFMNRDDSVDMSTYKQPEPTERELELQKAQQYKSKMRSRLRALRRLIEKYNDILPNQNLDQLVDEVHALEKSIGRLNAYATMVDCTVRSANKMQKWGFDEGADFLHKTAVEPLPPPMPEAPPAMPVGPQASGGMNDVINKLEEISQALKSRDLIRELASADIALNDLGVAAYFPELSFAQSKLIESFGYASNKLEDIIAKLRGTGKKQQIGPDMPEPPAPMPEMPPVAKAPEPKLDAGEIMTKPVGEVEEELPTE